MESATPRYAYVIGVALHDMGRRAEALRVLGRSLAQTPDDIDTLVVLALYSEEAGDMPAARRFAERLEQLRPEDPQIRALVTRLRP